MRILVASCCHYYDGLGTGIFMLNVPVASYKILNKSVRSITPTNCI